MWNLEENTQYFRNLSGVGLLAWSELDVHRMGRFPCDLFPSAAVGGQEQEIYIEYCRGRTRVPESCGTVGHGSDIPFGGGRMDFLPCTVHVQCGRMVWQDVHFLRSQRSAEQRLYHFAGIAANSCARVDRVGQPQVRDSETSAFAHCTLDCLFGGSLGYLLVAQSTSSVHILPILMRLLQNLKSQPRNTLNTRKTMDFEK